MNRRIREIEGELRRQVKTLLTAAFGFVAALSWNEAIKAFIESYVPRGQTWPFLVVNAFVITIIAVVVITLISKVEQERRGL